jgi:ankyrin repeat protein
MKIRKIVSLVLLGSLAVFAAYGMEMPEKGSNANDVNMSEIVDWPTEIEKEDTLDRVYNESNAIEEIIKDAKGDDKKAAGEINRKLQDGLRDENGKLLIMTKEEYGAYLLEEAIDRGLVEVVRVLLEHGANMYGSCNSMDNTFLQAINARNEKLIECFLKNGYDVRRKYDYYNKTPLEYALKNDPLPNILKLLLQYGANPEIFKTCKLATIFEKISPGTFRDSRHINDLIDALKLLYSYDVDINKSNGRGKTALRWAIRKGYPEIVALLSKYQELNPIQVSDLGYALKALFKHAKYTRGGGDVWEEIDETPHYKKIIEILTPLAKKTERLQSIHPDYNEALFNAKHESNMPAYKNAEKIKEFSSAMMRGENREDLMPYISARAPKLLEFYEYLENNAENTNYVPNKRINVTR